MQTFKKVFWLTIILSVIILLFSCNNNKKNLTSSYAVLIGLNPEDAAVLSNYQTVVIDAQYFTKDEIAAVQANGTAVYTYLNIGSIETFREGYDSMKEFILAPYDNWPDEYWVDVSRTEWQGFVADQAAALVEKGVDGFFLDNADVYYLYPSDAIYNGIVEMITSLEQYDKPILINGGDVFVSRAMLDAAKPLSAITGVNQECVFTNINFTTGALIRQSSEDSRYYQAYLARCKEAGLDVYLTEYAKFNKSVYNEIAQYCDQNGFHYYISSSINLD